MDLYRLTNNLFETVRLGQTDNILKFLRFVDVNVVNENGETPLIVAAQNRNHVVQKLLVKQGANVNKKDTKGRTALHYESGHGDVRSITLLLAKGTSLNKKDNDGRTPLHFATAGGHEQAVDILVFSGADSTIQDNEGITPKRLSRKPEISRLMKESIQTINAIKYGYIKIDRGQLRNGESRYFQHLDCTIKTPPKFAIDDVYMVSRRVRPEFGNKSLKPITRELLLSDTFEFRFADAHIVDTVEIDVPLYSEVEAYEAVHIKTNEKPKVAKDTIQSNVFKTENETVICSVCIDFQKVDSFIMVTSPKKDYFPVTGKYEKFISEIDSMVTFSVEDGTFTNGGSIIHEILKKPIVTSEEFPNLISSTHFYEIKHVNSDQPTKEVKITLPLPDGYIDSKDVSNFVLMRDNNEEYNEESWSIIDRDPKVENNMITIYVPHFSSIVFTQYSTKSESIIKMDSEKRLQASATSECEVIFLSLVKYSDEDQEAEVKTECYGNSDYKKRIEHWENEDYIDQNPSYSEKIKTYSGQTFILDVKGGVKKSNSGRTSLEYHPKRKQNNLRDIKIEAVNKLSKDTANGRLVIKACDSESKNKDKKQTKAEDREIQQELFIKIRINNAKSPDVLKSINYKGFTDDKFMKEIYSNLTEDEKEKLLVKLHIDVKTTTSLDEKMLFKWRDMVLSKIDLGVPDLILSLSEIGRRDVANTVMEKLKQWKKRHKKLRIPFVRWLLDLDTESNTAKTYNDLMEPYSNKFLKALACKLEPSISPENFFGRLNIPHSDMKHITTNPLYEKRTQIYILTKMFRDSCSTKMDCFERIYQTLQDGEDCLSKAAEWCIEVADKWVNSIKSTDESNEFCILLKSFVGMEKKSRKTVNVHNDDGVHQQNLSDNDDTDKIIKEKKITEKSSEQSTVTNENNDDKVKLSNMNKNDNTDKVNQLESQNNPQTGQDSGMQNDTREQESQIFSHDSAEQNVEATTDDDQTRIDPTATDDDQTRIDPTATDDDQTRIDPTATGDDQTRIDPTATDDDQTRIDPTATDDDQTRIDPTATDDDQTRIDPTATDDDQTRIDPTATDDDQTRIDPTATDHVGESANNVSFQDKRPTSVSSSNSSTDSKILLGEINIVK